LTQKILILGGSGFVGRHLTKVLAKDYHLTIIARKELDVLSSFAEIKNGDFRSERFIDECLSGIDLVIHLVSGSVPASSDGNEYLDIENNLIPSIHLLKAMKRHKVPKLIFLSSGGAVYGNQTKMPITEDFPLNPVSTYGIIKATIEHFITMHSRQFDIDYLILRTSNLYGPNQSHSGVNGIINTMMDRLLDGNTLEIWGDGTQEKDYLYISDLVEAIKLGIERKISGTYNIGSNTGTSLNQLRKLIERISMTEINSINQEPRPYDVQRFILDSALFHKKTGWVPKISLAEGIKKVWDHKNK